MSIIIDIINLGHAKVFYINITNDAVVYKPVEFYRRLKENYVIESNITKAYEETVRIVLSNRPTGIYVQKTPAPLTNIDKKFDMALKTLTIKLVWR